MPQTDQERDVTYRLEVPLDASCIKDFKPDRALKVVAYGPAGRAQERTVKLDNSGGGRAAFTFSEPPGRLRVVVGPENASAEQMKGLQTIGMDVSPRRWAGTKELVLAQDYRQSGLRQWRRSRGGSHGLRLRRGLVVVVVVKGSGRLRYNRSQRRLRNRFHPLLRMVAVVVVGAPHMAAQSAFARSHPRIPAAGPEVRETTHTKPKTQPRHLPTAAQLVRSRRGNQAG